MTPEPTLSDVHADLVGRLEQDKRLRSLEQSYASQQATLQTLVTDLATDRSEARDNNREMEKRLMAAIESIRPKNQWQVASVLVAAAAVLVAVLALVSRH